MSTGDVVGERWKLGKTLGRGSFAAVKVATDITGQMKQPVAVKCFKDVDNELDMMDIEQEIRIMKDLDNIYCLALYDVVVDEDSGSIFVVMELAKEELTQRMEDSSTGKLAEGVARKYFGQLMEGIHYLHGHNIIHRDIKFENVMLDKHDDVKIGDFGMSKVARINQQLATRCGSTRYISPEMALMQPGDTYDGRAMDVWSSGVLLFAMLTGTLPFPQEALGDMLKAITRGAYKIPSFISSEAHDLITRMLAIDSAKRLTLDQIRAHPWLQSAKVPARPQKLETRISMDQTERQHVDSEDRRKAQAAQKQTKRGRPGRRTSNARNVLRGRKSGKTDVDGVATTAEMVRTIFAVFKQNYHNEQVDWDAFTSDPRFTGRYMDLLGEVENIRFENITDSQWKAMHLNLWNAMYIHVCAVRRGHPETMRDNDLRKFFTEEYYQVGVGEKPASLATLEERLVDMSKDPRVLFGLCKLTISSPALVLFSAEVDSELEEVVRHHCSSEVKMEDSRGEMFLPRLFKESETGRNTLGDFVKHKLVKDTPGLIPWVNDYLPQWKKDKLLAMAMAGKRVAVGFMPKNLLLLPSDRCRIVRAAGLNTPAVKAEGKQGCCGR